MSAARAADDDWRLQGQAAWLTGRHLTWKTWQAPRTDCDHDHCDFCWAKFGPADLEADVLAAGGVTVCVAKRSEREGREPIGMPWPAEDVRPA